MVTILILVDGFLQLDGVFNCPLSSKSHNPYFSRWFSAINTNSILVDVLKGHNPYFSRWFSAISLIKIFNRYNTSHNPYFSRWFSAIF